MKTLVISLSIGAAAMLSAGCGESPKVVQGTIVSHNASARTVVIKDECPPNVEVTISTEIAETGAECQPGDLVRAACRDEGGKTVAVRLMNLSRQKELGFLAKPGTRKKCR